MNRYLFLTFALTFAPAVAGAQNCTDSTCPDPVGSLVDTLTELRAGSEACEADEPTEALTRSTADGEMSIADFQEAMEDAGGTINDCEMAELREALNGRLLGGQTFTVSDEVKAAAKQMIYRANMFENTVARLDGNTGLGSYEIPDAVREVVVEAKLNGAKLYDVDERDDDGELVYAGGDEEGRYPSLPEEAARQNMAFDYTVITPASLRADREDSSEHLRMTTAEDVTIDPPLGQAFEVEVQRYRKASGADVGGTVTAAYNPHYHLVRPLSAFELLRIGAYPGKTEQEQLEAAGYPSDFTTKMIQEARTSNGSKWASNCAILSDGSFHCLPAIRSHADAEVGVLTNPAIARGQQLMWNGHMNISWDTTADKPVVTRIGTSGRIAKRAGRTQDIFIDPISLLKAWGWKYEDEPGAADAPGLLRRGLEIRSEHSRVRHLVDHDRAIIYGDDTTDDRN